MARQQISIGWCVVSSMLFVLWGCTEGAASSVDDQATTIPLVSSAPTTEQVAPTTVTASEIDPEPCQIANELIRADREVGELEPFAFQRRDPVIVELRHLIGMLRIQSWISNRELWGDIAVATGSLERADFSESGLLTAQEASAALELSRALGRHCGQELSADGVLLAS